METTSKCAEQFLSYCKNQRNLSDHTLKAYALDLNQFIGFVGLDNSITNLVRNDLSSFHNHLCEKECIRLANPT